MKQLSTTLSAILKTFGNVCIKKRGFPRQYKLFQIAKSAFCDQLQFFKFFPNRRTWSAANWQGKI